MAVSDHFVLVGARLAKITLATKRVDAFYKRAVDVFLSDAADIEHFIAFESDSWRYWAEKRWVSNERLITLLLLSKRFISFSVPLLTLTLLTLLHWIFQLQVKLARAPWDCCFVSRLDVRKN